MSDPVLVGRGGRVFHVEQYTVLFVRTLFTCCTYIGVCKVAADNIFLAITNGVIIRKYNEGHVRHGTP